MKDSIINDTAAIAERMAELGLNKQYGLELLRPSLMNAHLTTELDRWHAHPDALYLNWKENFTVSGLATAQHKFRDVHGKIPNLLFLTAEDFDKIESSPSFGPHILGVQKSVKGYYARVAHMYTYTEKLLAPASRVYLVTSKLGYIA